MLVSIKYAAKFLGVCEKTLRRWDKKGILTPIRTLGGHRRYDLDALKSFFENGEYEIKSRPKTQTAAIYARVSSHKQKDDLKRQIDCLCSIAQNNGWKNIKIYKDIGSGLNDKRKSLRKIIHDAINQKFDKVYINYLDRLARFGTQIILDIFRLCGIEYEIVKNNEEDPTFEKVLVDNMIAIITSFSGKLYRSRRGKNKIEIQVA